MNCSLAKSIGLGVIFFLVLTEQLFAAVPYELFVGTPYEKEYVPAVLEQQIVEAALTTKPYSPLTQWLRKLYQSHAARSVVTLAGHSDYAYPVAISPDGSKVVTGSYDRTAKIWTIAGSLIATLSGHTGHIIAMAISHDGSKVVTGSFDGAKIWDMSDGSLLATLFDHAGSISSVAISHDGSKVVTGSWDRTAKIWNMTDGSLVATLAGHVGPIIFSCNKS